MQNLDIYLYLCAGIVITTSINKIVKHKEKLLPMLGIIISAFMVGFCYLYTVENKFDSFFMELGDDVVCSPEFYLDGMGFAVSRSQVDISGVDNMTTGKYDVVVNHAWQSFVIEVTVEDTTPPELTVRKGDIYIARNRRYNVEDFVEEVFDLSGEVELAITYPRINSRYTTAFYSNLGKQTFDIIAEDVNGNITTCTMTVVVDDPPELSPVNDFYVALDEEVDFLEYITAYDIVDGDLTSKITVDKSDLKNTVEGDYTITYSVTDGYGLSTSMDKLVRVCDKDNLQKMINEHKINRHDYTIVGAYNPYDSGIYEGNTIEQTLEAMNTCIVRLKHETDTGYSFGSGSVIEITDGKIIILTCAHVVHDYKSMDIYFYDGSKLKGTIAGKYGEKGQLDVAYVEVNVADASESLMDSIVTIHVDEDYWDSLPNGDPNTVLGYRANDERGNVWRERSGGFLGKTVKPPHFENNGEMLYISIPLYSGTSGSGIVDSQGYLYGINDMITNIWEGNHYSSYYWGTNLTSIIDGYEKVYGRKLYTHEPVDIEN